MKNRCSVGTLGNIFPFHLLVQISHIKLLLIYYCTRLPTSSVCLNQAHQLVLWLWNYDTFQQYVMNGMCWFVHSKNICKCDTILKDHEIITQLKCFLFVCRDRCRTDTNICFKGNYTKILLSKFQLCSSGLQNKFSK